MTSESAVIFAYPKTNGKCSVSGEAEYALGHVTDTSSLIPCVLKQANRLDEFTFRRTEQSGNTDFTRRRRWTPTCSTIHVLGHLRRKVTVASPSLDPFLSQDRKPFIFSPHVGPFCHFKRRFRNLAEDDEKRVLFLKRNVSDEMNDMLIREYVSWSTVWRK